MTKEDLAWVAGLVMALVGAGLLWSWWPMLIVGLILWIAHSS